MPRQRLLRVADFFSSPMQHAGTLLQIRTVRVAEEQLFETWRRTGSADALAEVYDRTAPALLRLALHLVRVPATAEDLVQATFLAAIEKAATYDATRPLLGWLVGILHNQAKWLMRREGRAVDASRLAGRDVADPLDGAAAAEFTAQVDEAIEALPEVYRPVLRLHLKHQLPAAEIAHALDRPAGTVRSQVVRGLELLRAALPAGVALGVAFAALLPSRGLAAVREVVLAHGLLVQGAKVAAAAAGTVVAAPVVAGVLTMKKLAVVVLAAAVLMLALRWPGSGTMEPLTPGVRDGVSVAVGMSQADRAASDSPAPPATDRQPVATPSPTWRLLGSVVADGVPFAGAEVQVFAIGDWGHKPELLAEGRSDHRGDYVVDLEALRGWAPIDLDRVKLMVLAWGEGRRSGREERPEIELPHHDPSQSLSLHRDLELVPACTIVGRILDELGRPVASAGIHLWRGRELLGYWTPTAADGRFRIGCLDVGDLELRCLHDRHGRLHVPFASRVGSGLDLGDLTMRATALLRFRVLFDDGTPAAGIRLSVGGLESRADANGRFVVARDEPGEYEVDLGGWLGEVQVVKVVSGEPERDLVLRDKHVIVPTFVDEHGAELRPVDVGWHHFESQFDAQLAAFAAGADLVVDLGSQGTGGGKSEQWIVDRGDWLWITANHGDAHGEALVHAVPPQNVYRPRIQLVERRRDASLRVKLRCDDGGRVDKFGVAVEQLRLGQPGTGLQPEPDAANEHGELYRCYPGRYLLRLVPRDVDLDREPGMLLGVMRPVERIVELRAGAEECVELVAAVGGRVRLNVHASGLEVGQQVSVTVQTSATDDVPRGIRNTFVRAQPRGWAEEPTLLTEIPLLWKPLLPPGRHLLTLRAPGYAETVLAVDIRPRHVTDLDVWLTKQ